MRVITGTARGRRLEPPQGTDTRPTSEMVKEAVMSIVQFELPGAAFLDLFAGCGQMGIEALSRGARSCAFIDNSKRACELIRRNIETAGFSGASRVITADAVTWLRGAEQSASAGSLIDIAFVDPPYGCGLAQKLLSALAGIMRENGIILVETQRGDVLPEKAGDFAISREYNYGKSKITRYAAQNADA